MAPTTAIRIPRPRPLLAIVHPVNLRPGHDLNAPVAEVMTASELAIAFKPKGKNKGGNAKMSRVPAPRDPSSGVMATQTSREHAARLLVRLYGSETDATVVELIADLEGKNQNYVSRVIDNLMVLLAEEPTPASSGQKRYARILYTQRLSVGDAETDAKFAAELERLTLDEAKRLIDTLISLPERRASDIPAKRDGEALHAVTEGMYRTPDGEIYKVQKAVHGSGQLYAKKLVKLGEPTMVRNQEMHYAFEMARGAIRQLRPEYKMTREDAKEFGDLYGCCVRCGAVLTDETSRDRGMGPVCNDKF